jgi:photosystem II stability/assembly factor-like uncharacterized protein
LLIEKKHKGSQPSVGGAWGAFKRTASETGRRVAAVCLVLGVFAGDTALAGDLFQGGFANLDFVETAGLPGGHISDIAFAPSDPNVLYLASNVNAMGVWGSDDGGESWQRFYYDDNFGATHTTCLDVDPVDRQSVLIGDLHGHIKKTADGGHTWRVAYEGNSPVFAVAFSRSQSSIAFAGREDGTLLKSTNGGETWRALSMVSQGGIGSLAIGPGNSNTLYVGSRTGVYKSVDGGSAWSQVLVGADVVEVAAARSDAETEVLLAAAEQGVFRSADAGATWSRVLTQHAHSVGVAASDSRVIYAGTNRGVYRSEDGGLSWVSRSEGIEHLDIGPLTVHPSDANDVVLGNNIWQWTFHYDPFPASTKGEGI